MSLTGTQAKLGKVPNAGLCLNFSCQIALNEIDEGHKYILCISYFQSYCTALGRQYLLVFSPSLH